MSNLREMFDRRKGKILFKERDAAYKIFENYYQSRDPQRPGVPQITYRPYLIDDTTANTSDNQRYAVNLSRRVVSYFGSAFSRPPKIWKSPLGEDEKSAQSQTYWLRHVLSNSRMLTLQPRQSHWLSLRGDCVYGQDWDEDKKQVLIRTYDPAWCYPTFSNLDLGAVDDMLICFQVSSSWANRIYGTHIKEETTNVYIYWDEQIRKVQVGEEAVPSMDRTHNLGFCPFRWVFGSPDGTLAQADIRDLPALQDLYNENLLLAMDAIRKQVDPAYFGTGIKGNLMPEPGHVLGIANDQAKIAVFPSGGDPAIMMGVMQMLEQNIEATSGISPISARGFASGSIVTGSAVRHQVEAIEARTETRRSALEDAYAQVGAQCFQILEKIFRKQELTFPTEVGAGEARVKGGDVKGWYTCYAQYGDYLGLGPQERVQAALMGLGRIYDDHMAIRLADLPDTTPEEMVARLADYQERQAITTGRAQSLAQLAAQAAQQKPPANDQLGQPPGVPSSAMPQPPTSPPAPGVAGMNVTLQDVQRVLALIRPQLKGPVWATGDLAVIGMSSNPMLVVGVQKDQALVNSVIQTLHGIAVATVPPDMPRLELV